MSGLRSHIAKGSLPKSWRRFFTRLPAFMRPDLNSAFYGDRWVSVLIHDEHRAFLHVLKPEPIGATGLADVQPWLGYAGPLVDGDVAWAAKALAAYSAACREMAIVAELIRFNPLGDTHELLAAAGVEVIAGRPVAYVRLTADDDAQLAEYVPAARRQVRSASRRLQFTALHRVPGGWLEFEKVYHESLERVGAAPRWHLTGDAFERLQCVEGVEIWGTGFTATDLAAVALTVCDSIVSYELLVGNRSMSRHPGCVDLLTHEIARVHARRGLHWLCLGGGRSAEEGDTLLRFKRKFARGNLRPMPIGFIIHDRTAYARLLAEENTLTAASPELQPSTEVFARWLPYRLRPHLLPNAAAGRSDSAVSWLGSSRAGMQDPGD